MKLIEILEVVLFLAVLQESGATNYCNLKSCSGSTHIGCNNNGAFAKACSPNATIMTMTATLQAALLEKHNAIRNQIAKGAVTKFQPAVRMATMRWDPELERLAVLNVKQCEMKHDGCRSTDNFPYAGQNLAYSSWSGINPTVESEAMSHVDMWYNEQMDTTIQYINNYSQPTNGNMIGHFTQLIQEKATHVGCGILRVIKGGFTYQYMACNYAFINVLSRPVYQSGAVGGSKCTTGENSSYTSLCSVNEVYDVKTL